MFPMFLNSNQWKLVVGVPLAIQKFYSTSQISSARTILNSFRYFTYSMLKLNSSIKFKVFFKTEKIQVHVSSGQVDGGGRKSSTRCRGSKRRLRGRK